MPNAADSQTPLFDFQDNQSTMISSEASTVDGRAIPRFRFRLQGLLAAMVTHRRGVRVVAVAAGLTVGVATLADAATSVREMASLTLAQHDHHARRVGQRRGVQAEKPFTEAPAWRPRTIGCPPFAASPGRSGRRRTPTSSSRSGCR